MIGVDEMTDVSCKMLDRLAPSSVDSKLLTASEVPESQDNDEEDSEFPPDDDIFDMIKDVNLYEPLATTTERYFTPYYKMNFLKEGEDICIRIHTNRLCMISLAPSHVVFRDNRKIDKIDFQITDKLNRADNAVSGKAKHGAQPLHETSKICTIHCTNGEQWTVRCGMNGKLTEANTDLLDNPELLKEPPHKGGYLAIVLPKIQALDKLKKQLMTQDTYDKMIEDRSNIENVTNRTNGTVKRSREDDIEGCKEKIMKTEVTESEQMTVNDSTESSM